MKYGSSRTADVRIAAVNGTFFYLRRATVPTHLYPAKFACPPYISSYLKRKNEIKIALLRKDLI